MSLSGILFLPFALLLLLLLAGLWYRQQIRRPKNFPPGPEWLPVVGNLPALKKLSLKYGGQHIALEQLAATYNSNIIGLKLGDTLAIFVMGYNNVRQVFISDEYEGRPDNFFIRLRCLGNRLGITCTDGPLWHEQRSFVARHLRTLGFGKKPMEIMIQDEIKSILNILENNTKELHLEPIFAPSVLNILWTLTAGTTLSLSYRRLTYLLDLLQTRSKAFDMAGGTLNQLPWLRYIIPERIGYNLLVRLNKELTNFFAETILEHKKTWYPDRQDDLIYSFISEMKKNHEASEHYTDNQLVMICLDLFIAGAITTSNTLDFIFLQMLLYPHIQEKAAKCLNDAIPSSDMFTYADRLKVPYIEAIIMETARMYSVVPIIGPRKVLRNTTLDGYYIPKNTSVFINAHSVHYDIEYWGDPTIFRPERFINDQGKLNVGDHVLNFGLGKRRCLGELLARQCIFLFFAAVLRKYKICTVPGTKLPSSTPIPGITTSPQKYKVHLIERL